MHDGSSAPLRVAELKPTVPAEAYDRNYFLHNAMGADVWRESGGRKVAGLYEAMLRLAEFRSGLRLLDVGTGRGELLRVAIELGAEEAVGVDYSPAAIELARTTLRAAGNPPGARVLQADAWDLPAESDRFDLVTMLDVVEHLAPAELARALSEAHRILRPGGALFVHTAPNALIYEVTYRAQRLLRPRRMRRWPRDPRLALERVMHVNEQTPRSLRRALRDAGFGNVRVWLGRWVYTDFVPDERAKRLYRLLARVRPLRGLAVTDLFGSAAKAS